MQMKAEEERSALAARLNELEEVSAGAVAAAQADAKRAQQEAAAKVEKNNERANEVRHRFSVLGLPAAHCSIVLQATRC